MANYAVPGQARYSVVESANLGMGQLGVAFISGTATYTPPTGQVVIAIQFTEDALFDSADATTADSEWPTDAQGGPGTNSVAINQTVMPQGITIFGRWKTVALDQGSAFLYLGG
jgi:hypothetical protein|tara:strand:+ start:3163 stop:3504 length:342 start_codon:yes stop_codon:yes gene_type:complete